MPVQKDGQAQNGESVVRSAITETMDKNLSPLVEHGKDSAETTTMWQMGRLNYAPKLYSRCYIEIQTKRSLP